MHFDTLLNLLAIDSFNRALIFALNIYALGSGYNE